MKKLAVLTTICLSVATLGSLPLQAQSSTLPMFSNSNSQIYPEEQASLDPSKPDSPTLTVPQGSTQYAINSLLRTTTHTAGAPMKDSKEISPAAEVSEDQGFSSPEAYSEYRFAQIQDNRTVGFDGPQHNGIVGFDFESYWKTIVGFNFTYTNSNLDTGSGIGAGPKLTNSSNSYFFSPYIARNFCDWINVGTAFTYGRTDSSFQLISPTPGASLALDTAQDSYAVSPFIGVSHSWGSWSFSSTPTYIWGYDHFSFAPPSPGGTAGAAPDAKTLNQTILWLNNVQYAISDKWSVSFQANLTVLLTTQSVPVATGLPPNSISHQWMSFGGRTDYSFNKDGSVFAAYEHDAFSSHYEDYRIRTGISYNF